MKKLISLLLISLCISICSYGQLVIQRTTATSGTVTCQDTGQPIQIQHDAGATTSLTIAFPATPYNGQVVTLSSAGGITTMTLTTAVGSFSNALSTMGVGAAGAYVYNSSTTKWVKIQ